MREEFFINRNGKRFVLFAGLLDEAHNRGLNMIDTDLIQIPTPENGMVAVCKAKVEMADERTFSGIGDAAPDNVGKAIVPHIIRMAETRAKARAIRDAINVGVTALEELSDDEEHSAVHHTGTPTTSDLPLPQYQPQPLSTKGQIGELRKLAVELRGDGGDKRLEEKIGKPLGQLTREEADAWIGKLQPQEV